MTHFFRPLRHGTSEPGKARTFRPILPGLILLAGTLPASAEPQVRMARENLMQFRNAEGTIRPVTSADQWERRRAEILRGMQEVMGPLPEAEAGPPAVTLLEKVDAGSYQRRLITYEADPGSETPAYLCIPHDVLAGRRRAPAILCLHPTDNQVGHQVVVGLGGRPGRAYAAELAERGYVTLSPSYPHLANYWPNLGKLGYASGTMKAIHDNRRGLDLLESMEGVESARGFGAIGHSLGGHNAIYTAVFDRRIAAVASSCGFDSFLNYYDGDERNWYFGRGWCQIRYMPRLSNYRGRLETIPFDFHELLGALAPRPVFVNAPLGDSNFRWRSVDACAAAARPVYELLGDPEDLTVRHPEAEHSFPREMRDAAYALLDAVLRGGEPAADVP